MTVPDDHCSIAATLAVIGDRWTMLVLREVFRGVHRFSEMQQELGIARNLLSNRLGRLVDEGVLEKVPYQDRPVRHEYRLTTKGAELSPALVALMHWGDRHYAPDGPPTVLVCRQCHTPVELAVSCPGCDEHLRPTEIRSRPGPARTRPPLETP